ncbi:Arsenite methyltransferase [Vanrija pseudolonga]|uniref:Arsenite methyltransferase n=1 Tax=Vanrija pseudolonga TaxID=143232 RepID=A0AAF1BNF1_9TREE|nr:Arsenite methyltransferase [Vanrija pseudolonga]
MTSNTHTLVRDKYAAAATVSVGGKASCCGSKATILDGVDPITKDLYNASEAAEVPEDALLASFGCGNPTALAKLEAGQVVLDLGSGGGIDVLLSAKRVGPSGKAYGLDMTPEMVALARKNAATAGATNVEFLLGTIEAIPLPDNSVDVIISNCVINLPPDKDAVLAEAFRVLKPGGRFAVSDIVLARALPDGLRRNIELWAGCIAGALIHGDYEAKLAKAGFEGVDIEPTRVYSSDDAGEFATAGAASDEDKKAQLEALDGAVYSAFIRGTKPL